MTKTDKRIALITGSSRGIGAAIAKRFAANNIHVIITGRNIGALEEVDSEIQNAGGTSTITQIDLADFDKIDQLGAHIYDKFGKLDILVGNAAILGQLTPVSHIDPKMWQMVIDINLTANYRLIRSMDKLLQLSPAGRAIFVTSSVANTVYPYWGAYAASKAGLESIVKTYAAENQKNNLKVNIVDPSGVATNMRKQAFPGEDQNSLKKPEEITDIFLKLIDNTLVNNGEIFNAQ